MVLAVQTCSLCADKKKSNSNSFMEQENQNKTSQSRNQMYRNLRKKRIKMHKIITDKIIKQPHSKIYTAAAYHHFIDGVLDTSGVQFHKAHQVLSQGTHKEKFPCIQSLGRFLQSNSLTDHPCVNFPCIQSLPRFCTDSNYRRYTNLLTSITVSANVVVQGRNN